MSLSYGLITSHVNGNKKFTRLDTRGQWKSRFIATETLPFSRYSVMVLAFVIKTKYTVQTVSQCIPPVNESQQFS